MQKTSSASQLVYERIAEDLATRIQQGVFRIGDRLPSIRQICQRERVSPASAMHAMSLLESQGLVEGRPKSGFYVLARRAESAPQPDPLPFSAQPSAVGVSDTVAQVFREAGDAAMVPLGAAIPAPELLPNEKLSRCLAAAARDDPMQMGRYDVSAGHPEFRRQLALRFSSIGCRIPPEEIIVTHGAMEALNLAVRTVARPGDVIAVESPCYFGILEILESYGLKVLQIPSTCEKGINIELLESALEMNPIKALVLVTNFSNPSGSCLAEEKRKRLMTMLADYGVPLIEDDVYGDLHFGPERPRPVKAYEKDGAVLYCGSFTKTLVPGMRVGWIAAGRYTESVRRLKLISSVSTTVVNQLALVKFIESGSIDRHLRQLRAAFRSHVAHTSEAILEHFPEGTALSQPTGGCFLWVQLPDRIEARELQQLAASKGISIIPGEVFCPQASIHNHIRISCTHPFTEQTAAAIATLGKLVRSLAVNNLKHARS